MYNVMHNVMTYTIFYGLATENVKSFGFSFKIIVAVLRKLIRCM